VTDPTEPDYRADNRQDGDNGIMSKRRDEAEKAITGDEAAYKQKNHRWR